MAGATVKLSTDGVEWSDPAEFDRRDEQDRDYLVWVLAKHFGEVASGVSPIWGLKHVIGCLKCAVEKDRGLRPTAEQRDQLLRAASRAKTGALRFLPNPTAASRSHSASMPFAG